MNKQQKHHGLTKTLAVTFAVLSLSCGVAHAAPPPATPETSKYLVIGTGQGSDGNEFAAFRQSNTELGANQDVVSTPRPSTLIGGRGSSLPTGSVPNLFDVFLGTPGANATSGGNRWNDTDSNNGPNNFGVPDTLRGARPLFEGIDFSGNVALTGSLAKFESSNSDVNANIGIHCNRAGDCFPNPSSNNSYFSGPNVATAAQNLNAGNGISQFIPTPLIDELKKVRDYIVGLVTESTMTAGFVNRNIKDSTLVVTDLDLLDTNNDGVAVINISVGNNKFELNNTDWILQSTKGTKAIFRMADGTYFDFSNSSIMLGDGTLNSTKTITELGAVFFQDAYKGTNQLFNLNNVILGGIGLYDFTDFNPLRTTLLSSAASVFNPAIGSSTQINMQNAQGCAQFISHEVVMSNNRWNRCTTDQPRNQVPEPSSLLLLSLALLGMAYCTRARQRQTKP